MSSRSPGFCTLRDAPVTGGRQYTAAPLADEQELIPTDRFVPRPRDGRGSLWRPLRPRKRGNAPWWRPLGLASEAALQGPQRSTLDMTKISYDWVAMFRNLGLTAILGVLCIGTRCFAEETARDYTTRAVQLVKEGKVNEAMEAFSKAVDRKSVV